MTTIDRLATDDAPTDRAAVELPAALTAPEAPTLPDWLVRARQAVEAAASDSLAIPDSALEKQWLWRDVDTGDGVRYGIYRAAETIEAAAAELEAALAGAPARPPAAIRSAPATIARWALQGRLAALQGPLVALDDSLLDRVPKEGEWTARKTLAHTVGGQRGYGVYSRWWLSQPLGPDRPTSIPDAAETELDATLPPEDSEAEGSIAEIRARLDAALDEWALRYASLDEAALAMPARWAGVPVDIGFRIARWGSHIYEHTIQLDKTLGWLGYSPTEPARIVGDLYTTWGRLEARIFPVAPAGTEAAVAAILVPMGETLISEARSVRAAAEA